MGKVNVIYGSTTGTTEAAAQKIAAGFGVEAKNVATATAADFADADLLILGTSTWGAGDLQDDWADKLSLLEGADLAGKKVAVFGFGDQDGFTDTFCDGMGILAKTAAGRGAEIIGKTSTDGYSVESSVSVEGGQFWGLALDDNSQSDKTDARIDAWIELLKK